MGDSAQQRRVREHRRWEARLRNLITFAIEHLQEGETPEALIILNSALAHEPERAMTMADLAAWTDEDRADVLRLREMVVAEVQRSRCLEAASRGLLAALDAMYVDGTAAESAAYANAADAMRKALGA